MEAILTRPKQKYHFTRKMTDEEIGELIDNYEYTPDYEDDNGAIWDEFGNPTEATIRAKYEVEHGLSDNMTLDEFFAELDELSAEAKQDTYETFATTEDLFAEWDKLWEEANPGEHR